MSIAPMALTWWQSMLAAVAIIVAVVLVILIAEFIVYRLARAARWGWNAGAPGPLTVVGCGDPNCKVCGGKTRLISLEEVSEILGETGSKRPKL